MVPEKKKKRKNPRQEQEIKVSRITARGKKKKLLVKKKENAYLVRPLEKKIKGYAVSGQKKTKHLPRILQCYNYKSAQHKWS